MRPLALLLAAAALCVARPSLAASVTLNGVNIDGVTGQRFENCTVVIDVQGNVNIQAKGYAVKGADASRPSGSGGAPAANGNGNGGANGRTTTTAAADGRGAGAGPAARVTRRYFLATEHDAPGTQFDLAIFINAQWIREVKAGEPQLVMEITKYLRPGPNKITLAATKRITGERLAYGADVKLKVVVGEGNVGGGHVMIDLPLVETARTAAEIDDRTEEFVVEAR